jgi:hypothetical protein
MDCHDRIESIVFCREQKLSLDLLDKSPEFGDGGLEFSFYRLSLARKVDKSLSVFHLVGNLPVESKSFLETGAFLKGFTGTVLVGPKTGVSDQGLQFIKLALAGTGVKGTSGRLRPATLSCRTLRSVHRT